MGAIAGRGLVPLALAGALVAGGACCWQLPWRAEAVVVGQIWTPQLAVAMLIAGQTGLAVCAVSGVRALHRRWRSRSWAFEGAALVITAVTLVWLLGIGVTALGLIAADASFTESQVGDHVTVVRTTTTPDAVERTTGQREGLLVRWGSTRATSW